MHLNEVSPSARPTDHGTASAWNLILRSRNLVPLGGTFVSIVRIGLGETKKFGDGYDAIFGKKKSAASKKPATPAAKGKKPAKGKKKVTK
jgi:hypothetical protein